ncbi:cytochrome P450 [Atractiella rhizophila]|nr:cytochrome P450 [Atractiella rhizophila]
MWKRGKELTALAIESVKRGDAHGVQQMESRRTIYQLLTCEDEERWKDHIMRFGASVMTGLAYGFSCPSIDFPKLVTLNRLNQRAFNGILGFSIINFIPILDAIPGPLNPWRALAAPKLKEDKDFYDEVHREAKAGKNVGAATWLKTIFSERPEDEALVDQLTAAGAETTGTSLVTFVLAWIMFPEGVEKVREQVDRVCGDELPSFSHKKSLPYVEAAAAETLRWRPDVPLGIPHRATVTQTITLETGQTYTIPKDSILTVNGLIVDNDEERFPNPTRFDIDRHLDHEGKLKRHDLSTFGWSRRKCPGEPFATDSLFITIASLLWAFDVEGEKGFNYEHVAYEADFNNEALVFPAKFKVRSAEKAKAIKRYEAEENTLES